MIHSATPLESVRRVVMIPDLEISEIPPLRFDPDCRRLGVCQGVERGGIAAPKGFARGALHDGNPVLHAT